MKEKLILANGTEIEIEIGSSISDMRVLSDTMEDMVSTWEMFENENLKSVQLQNTDGVETGNYESLVLINETSTIQKDGSILTSFHFREKTELELLREEVNELKESRDIHNGAIADLGEAVSNLSEGSIA